MFPLTVYKLGLYCRGHDKKLFIDPINIHIKPIHNKSIFLFTFMMYTSSINHCNTVTRYLASFRNILQSSLWNNGMVSFWMVASKNLALNGVWYNVEWNDILYGIDWNDNQYLQHYVKRGPLIQNNWCW